MISFASGIATTLAEGDAVDRLQIAGALQPAKISWTFALEARSGSARKVVVGTVDPGQLLLREHGRRLRA